MIDASGMANPMAGIAAEFTADIEDIVEGGGGWSHRRGHDR